MTDLDGHLLDGEVRLVYDGDEHVEQDEEDEEDEQDEKDCTEHWVAVAHQTHVEVAE